MNRITISPPRTPTIVIADKPRGPAGVDGHDGAPGPVAYASGALASRPAVPDHPMAYVATDAANPLSTWDGTAWADVPLAKSGLVTRVVDATKSRSTTITALNSQYQITGLQTEDKVWPGGVARISVLGLWAEHPSIMSATDSVSIAVSLDSGATWTIVSAFVAYIESANGTLQIPEMPIVGEVDTIASGVTVRFRAQITRVISGTVPVTVQWRDNPASLTVEVI